MAKMTLNAARDFITGLYCTEDNYSLVIKAVALEQQNKPAYQSGIDICHMYEDTFNSFEDLLETINQDAESLYERFKD